MDKKEFTQGITQILKLVRTEYGLTQDEMAVIIGISKKSLVESEKGRRELGWTESVALANIFSDSSVLQSNFGGDINDTITAIAFDNVDVSYPKTMGGKIWWKVVKEDRGYKIQQNIVSNHYRLLDENNRRLYFSFHLKEVEEYLNNI